MIIIMYMIIVGSDKTIAFNGERYRCAVVRSGFTNRKTEGDGATPRGRFLLREVYVREDSVSRPETRLPVYALRPDDGWCDDPVWPEYNTKISLPFDGSHERLWRDDDTYDVIVVIGYNDAPVVAGKGSAIFMHVARPGYTPTEGCVALAKQDLLEVLRHCTPDTVVSIDQ